MAPPIGCAYAQGFTFPVPCMIAATELIAASPWLDDDLTIPGTEIQLQMWPAEQRPLRLS